MEPSVPELRFAPARRARLAYQVFGSGPTTMVAVPPLAQNIEVVWERAEIRSMLDRFGSFARFVHYDKRGTGSSDRTSVVPGLDERVDDLRAVMDAAEVRRAHLFAQSGGGPTSLMFAASYPDRVQSVILHGSGARLAPSDLTAGQIDEIHRRQDEFAQVWGTAESTTVARFAPSLAADDEFRAWHQRYERSSAGSDSLRELLRINLELDVRDVLPLVDVPVLVLHRTGDQAVSIEFGREVAGLVSDGRLVEEAGSDHFAYAGGIDGWMTEVERFVTGTVSPRIATTPRRRSVRIVTLGRFAVEVDGDELATSVWGSRLARELCKRLVVARGWPVTRDELADLLWPDEVDERRLGARLSVQLSAVRRVLGGGVQADRRTVALDLSEVATDLEEFFAAADDEHVVAVCGGEFLPADQGADWSVPMRQQVTARFAAAARRVAVGAVEQGRLERAVELGHRCLGLDPYDEAAHRIVIAALLRGADVGKAREAHARWQTSMAELDVVVDAFDPHRAGDLSA